MVGAVVPSDNRKSTILFSMLSSPSQQDNAKIERTADTESFSDRIEILELG